MAGGDKGHIYIWCPDVNDPVGGIKILYRHVDLLNAAGISATLLHNSPGFRCTWFENRTIIGTRSLSELRPFDFVMIPEVAGDSLREPTAATKIVFNQNCYYTFKNLDVSTYRAAADLYRDVQACLVVSEDSRAYIRHAFPELPVYRVHNSIDPSVFFPQARKSLQICFMPRKNADDAAQVFAVLGRCGVLDDVRVVAIDGVAEHVVSEIMAESSIFFSFGDPEGSPLPPAEAMLAGCIVVGYHGFGGREYFRRRFCYPISRGDIRTFVQVAERVISMMREGHPELTARSEAARQFIATQYSPERERRDVLRFWRRILGDQGRVFQAERSTY